MYVVKCMSPEDTKPYLVDAEVNTGIWTSSQRDARRFETRAEAIVHVARAGAYNWLDQGGIAKIVRLVPRKSASSPPAKPSPPSSPTT